jgi:dTMP kinase
MEGIMGSGKTTLAKMLSEEIGGVYYNTPESFHNMRPFADNSLSLEARYYFYLSLNMQVSFEVAQLLKKGPVVCDKYIWSTFCYHKTFGLDISEFPQIDIISPDFCFLIFCDDNIRLERLSRRDPVNDYSKDFKRQESERMCLLEFKKVLSDSLIDNSSDNPQVALSKILSTVN